jgi:hypothetical protein
VCQQPAPLSNAPAFENRRGLWQQDSPLTPDDSAASLKTSVRAIYSNRLERKHEALGDSRTGGCQSQADNALEKRQKNGLANASVFFCYSPHRLKMSQHFYAVQARGDFFTGS